MGSALTSSGDPEVESCFAKLVELRDALVLTHEVVKHGLRFGSGHCSHAGQTGRAHYTNSIARSKTTAISVERWVWSGLAQGFTRGAPTWRGGRRLVLR